MNEKIEKLLLEKDFEALNEEERAGVLRDIGEREYRQMRKVCLSAPTLEADFFPPARIQTALALKMKAGKPGFSFARVPISLLALLIPAAALLGRQLRRKELKEFQVPVIVRQVDTVYQIKTVVRDRVRWRERVIFKEKPATSTVNEPAQAVHYQAPAFEISPVAGASLGDTPELIEFFTEGK